MVHKVLKLLSREITGLHEAAYLLAVFALLSQLLGLVRDRLLAHHFGAGGVLDIYYAAFKIPDFIFITVGSLVSVSVLVPFLIERMSGGRESEQKFINQVFSFFFLFIIAGSVLAFFFAPFLTQVIFPGIQGASLHELVFLTRVLLLSPFFLGLSNFLGSLSQAHRRFVTFAVSPLFYNIGIIIGIVFLSPKWGIAGIVFGVILGALMHFLLQAVSIAKDGHFPRLTLKLDWKEIKGIILLSFPRTLTLSAGSIALLFLLGMASLLEEGSIAVFNLAFNLQSVPLSIIGVSYSMAAFPVLSLLYGRGEIDAFVSHIKIAARHIIFWSIPISILFIVLRAQIVRTILGSGQFSWEDTRLTAAALALFSFGVVAQSISLLFIRGYYSASKTKKPLTISLLSSAFIAVFAFFLVNLYKASDIFQFFFGSLFKVEGVEGTILLMLPLSFALGSILNAAALWFTFTRDFADIGKSLRRTFLHSFGASLIAGVVAHYFLDIFDDYLDLNTLGGIFFQGFLAGIFGILAGILVLKLLNNEELEDFLGTIKKKIWKAETLSPPTLPS